MASRYALRRDVYACLKRVVCSHHVFMESRTFKLIDAQAGRSRAPFPRTPRGLGSAWNSAGFLGAQYLASNPNLAQCHAENA